MRWRVTFRDKDGQQTDDVFEAASRTELFKVLSAKGINAVRIEEDNGKKRSAHMPRTKTQSHFKVWLFALAIAVLAAGGFLWLISDKDSGKPVFTQAEALEQAKAILLKHFGGYTIQEAEGGWIDDDKVYQEYTMVIYISDTTDEAVHAAADEMVQVFNQSSVLIQKNPTTTEFYSGAAK